MSIRRSLIAVLTVSLAAFLCASCAESGAEAWQPPTVVRVEGCKQVQTISPMYGIAFGSAIERTGQAEAPLAPVEDTTYALVRPGELLMFEGGPGFLYARADGTTLSFKVEDKGEGTRMLLAGKTVAIGLGEKEEQGWSWLREAPAEDLAALRMVYIMGAGAEGEIAEALPAWARGALARLAKANPRVGVGPNGEAAMRVMLEMFDPEWFWIGNPAALSAEAQALLAAEPRLHTLMMSGDPPQGLGFLSRLPRLRTLFINGWKGQGKDVPPPALPTIPSLRTLIAFGSEMKDLGPVGDQPNLEELALVVAGDLVDVGRLAEMPGLRTLSLLACSDVKDLSALSALKDLRWLVLPPGTTQEQFARICTEHPDLVVLHAVSCKEITDLAPLKRLRGLRVLSVAAGAPLDPVVDVTSLRLLGVGLKFPDKKEGEEEDTGQKPRDEEDKGPKPVELAIVRIMEANPDLAVVQVSGMCLGSGWILVLAPMAAGAWWLARRRRAAQRSAAM